MFCVHLTACSDTHKHSCTHIYTPTHNDTHIHTYTCNGTQPHSCTQIYNNTHHRNCFLRPYPSLSVVEHNTICAQPLQQCTLHIHIATDNYNYNICVSDVCMFMCMYLLCWVYASIHSSGF
eukprot:GHVQ01008833.1.p2 GENE.GHVQ01008833.1~~GHVQ01008833.1.p2  ORF type:complete len:121 (-),score=19.35 GHVQ01008833.1:641-1003(-)